MPFTSINRIRSYNFSPCKFSKPPIRANGNIWCNVLLGHPVKRQPAQQVTATQLRRSYQRERFAYFVPRGVDPSGLGSFCSDRCKSRSYDANGNWIWNQTEYLKCVHDCEKTIPPPSFPPRVNPEDGVIGPYLPDDGGTNVNIWGNGEAEGFDDYQVGGCPDLHNFDDKRPDTRPSTDGLLDDSVDQIFIRASPWRCECEMKEVCRVCRDGCVVTISAPQIDGKEKWPLGAPAPFSQTTSEMLNQLEACMGDRLSDFDIIRQDIGDGGSMTSLVFRLSDGDCGKCPNEK